VLADIGSISLILERVEKEAKPAAHYELRGCLIRETEARRKIMLLHLGEPLGFGACRAIARGRVVGCRNAQTVRGIRRRKSPIVLPGRRDEERRTAVRSAVWNEVGLPAICLVNRSKVVPTQTE